MQGFRLSLLLSWLSVSEDGLGGPNTACCQAQQGSLARSRYFLPTPFL